MARYDPSIGRIIGDEVEKKQESKNEKVLAGIPIDILPERITREQIFESPPTFLSLPSKEFDVLVSATPSVFNQEYWLSHSSATNISNFRDGQECQHLYILGNGNSTLLENSNIKTIAGSNLLMAAGKMYHLIFHNNVWYQV